MLPSLRKFGLTLAWAGVVLAAWSPGVAMGQQGVSVQGRVVSGTLEGAPVSNAAVVLHSDGPGGHQDAETLTDANGSFQFDTFTAAAGTTYGVSVRYQGGLYGRDIDLSVDVPDPVTLTVFEATDDEKVLTISSATLLIGGVDKRSRLLEAFEMVTIANASDRAYVPGFEPMKLLRFGLPPRAIGLQVDTALPGADVIQVDRGFALTASVPPGEHLVLFTYYVPYTGDAAAFAKSLPYGAQTLRIVVLEEIGLSSPMLGIGESTTIGSRRYRLLEGSSLERGAAIPIEIKNLPEPTLWDTIRRRIGRVRIEYVGPLGLAAFAVALLVFAMRQRRRTAGLMKPGEEHRLEVARLAEAIAAIDRQFEDGLIDGARHEVERARLRQRLLILRAKLSALPADGVAAKEGMEPEGAWSKGTRGGA